MLEQAAWNTVLYPVQVLGMLLYYLWEEEARAVPHVRVIAAPMGLLQLRPPLEEGTQEAEFGSDIGIRSKFCLLLPCSPLQPSGNPGMTVKRFWRTVLELHF